MSQKKPSRLSTKPGKNLQPENADSWVDSRNGNPKLSRILNPRKSRGNNETLDSSPTKRITFEVSEQQHRATKILAAQKGMTIKELMQSLLVTELNKQQ